MFASQLANETWDSINGVIKIEKAERRRAGTAAGGDIDDAAGEGERTWAMPLICHRSHGVGGSGSTAALAEAR